MVIKEEATYRKKFIMNGTSRYAIIVKLLINEWYFFINKIKLKQQKNRRKLKLKNKNYVYYERDD